MKRNCSPALHLERFSSTHVKKTIENHNLLRKILKFPYKDELAFPEFEYVPNSQVILYSFSSFFLDITATKKGKKKKGKSNRRKNTHFRELTFKIQFSLNTT